MRAPVPRCTHPSVAPASPSSRRGSVFTPESKCLSQAPGWQCGKILDTPRVKRGLALCSACLFAEKASKLPGVTATPVTVAPYPPEATGGTWQERGAQCHRISPARPALGGGSAAPEVTGTCPGASPGAGRTLCSRKPARGQVPCSKWPQLAGARGSSRPGAWPCVPSCPHPSQPGRACPWPSCPCGGHTRGAGTAPPPAAGQPS